MQRIVRRLLGAVLSAAFAGQALAASIEVTPTRIELDKDQKSAVVTVRNLGNDPVIVQTEVLVWSQRDGRDEYRPTRDVLATPPIVTIPERSEQVVRLALRRDPASTVELAYRLYVQEVPPPPRPGQSGLQVTMRIGIPVLVAPLAGAAAPRLAWQLTRDAAGRYLVVAENNGTASIRLSELSVSAGTMRVSAKNELAYVLPGARRAWVVPADEAARLAGPLRIQALSHTGPLDADASDTR